MKVYPLCCVIATFSLHFGACGSDNTPLGGASGTDAIAATGGTGTATGGVAGQTTAGGGQAPVTGSANGGAAGKATAAVAGAKAGAGGKAGSGVAGAGGKAGAKGGAAGTAGSAASACLKALKAGCTIRSQEACSSQKTKDIGTLVKGTEIKFGPYGAIMEQNVGKGFEIAEASGEASCATVAASFGEPPEITDDSIDLQGVDLTLYTVYRPACMIDGEKYPVITWGNGTCGQTETYGALLRKVASHGYIVFASNSRYTGNNGAMTRALDFAEAANKDSKSVYYNRLDLDKIGAMGHSQGGGATVTAARDSRIDAVIIWNATASASKPFLAVSGDNDITGMTPASMASSINSSAQPSAWLYFHKVPMTGSVSGHLTLMTQPERVVEAATAWWDYMLKGDKKAGDFLIGTSCGLCNKPDDFEYGHNSLLK